jgi:integrase
MKHIELPYIYDRAGIYYFYRRIPKDLERHYKCPKVAISLRTRSLRAAKAKTATLSAQLDEEWLTLRWSRNNDVLSRYRTSSDVPSLHRSNAPLIFEAKNIYLHSKGDGRPVTFAQAADRAINNLVSAVGDKPIDTYSRQDANLFRDSLFDRGLNKASVKRMFGTIRALVNFVTRELGLQDINTFSGLYLGEDDQQSGSKRQPIPLSDIITVQEQCVLSNDEGRWLIALISDTGLRLSEAAGLHKADVVLDSDYPHITLKPHQWRRLKTKGSERLVPLVGSALWAATQAIQGSDTEFLFPKYCNHDGCRANSASAALNKWLSPRVPKGGVIHSFRHSFRDRLRAVECPADIIDRLGGWAVGGVGEGYGEGYPLEVLTKWMNKALN